MSDTNNKKLFVGSIAWTTKDEDLKDFFSQAGSVVSASIIIDKMTNRSKGFGFVEMETEDEAQKAIEMLDGKDLNGRNIVVTIAKPREDRPRR